jgi:hypothetical protein
MRPKELIKTSIKTLKPKYYRDFGEKTLKNSFRYLTSILFISFILMAIIAIPKTLFVITNLDNSLADISQLEIEAKFKTEKPILIPSKNPIITLDTTGNQTLDDEMLLFTDKKLYYNVIGNKGEFEFNNYKFTENKEDSQSILILLMLLLLPGIFLIYYLTYLIKYIIIAVAFAIISFPLSKIMKNTIKFKQAFIMYFMR